MGAIPVDIRRKARKIRLLLLDVDGVLTDGGILLSSSGGEVKRFDVRDGHGLKLWIEAGHRLGLLTSRSSRAVRLRAKELGIRMVYQKVTDKLEVYEKIKSETGLADREIAYVGDDIVDLPVLRRVGFAVAVKDAARDLRGKVHYLTHQRGGRGAAREVVEIILQAQGKWQALIGRYLS